MWEAHSRTVEMVKDRDRLPNASSLGNGLLMIGVADVPNCTGKACSGRESSRNSPARTTGRPSKVMEKGDTVVSMPQ